MPRKSKTAEPAPVDPDLLINLGGDLEAVIEEIAAAPILEEIPPPVKKDREPKAPDSEETDIKRAELLVLASDGVISKRV